MTQDRDRAINWQVAIDDLSLRKASLRKEMRANLRRSRKVADTPYLMLRDALKQLKTEKCIAIYSALPDEPSITALLDDLPRHRWLLPRVKEDHLIFHHVMDTSRDLRPGAFGILEPLPHLPIMTVTEIDIFVCPGLAFDIHGGRLGRGRGFYDRVLSGAREDALKIGVGFGCQMVRDTFAEKHDISMNTVICHG